MKPLGELTVADLMTGEPICAASEEKLSVAIQRFADSGVAALPVVDKEQKIVGILSLVDLLEFTRELHSDISSMTLVSGKTRSFLLKLLVDDEAKTTVQDVMTQAVETVSPDTNAVVAAKMMLDGGFRHLPVTDADGRTLGILSTTDFVRAFADQAPLLAG